MIFVKPSLNNYCIHSQLYIGIILFSVCDEDKQRDFS